MPAPAGGSAPGYGPPAACAGAVCGSRGLLVPKSVPSCRDGTDGLFTGSCDRRRVRYDHRVRASDSGRNDGVHRGGRGFVGRVPGLPRRLDLPSGVEAGARCGAPPIHQRGGASMGNAPGRGRRGTVRSRRAHRSRLGAGARLPPRRAVVSLRGDGADQGLAPRDHAPEFSSRNIWSGDRLLRRT